MQGMYKTDLVTKDAMLLPDFRPVVPKFTAREHVVLHVAAGGQ